MSAARRPARGPAGPRPARAGGRGAEPALVAGAALLSALAILLGALSALPVYRTPQLWVTAAAGWAAAFALVWAGHRLRWGALTLAALLLGAAVLVVPLGVPGALGAGPAGLVRGLGDGLAAVALGWKQLLTLTLPVGSYQAVLVPFLVTVMAATAAAAGLALRGGRVAPLAAIPALAPVAFGVVFGSSRVSAPLELGPVTVAAPRELALWGAACVLGALWVAWSSGRGRRAALRLGRAGRAESARAGGPFRRPSALRALSGILAAAVALAAGLALAPPAAERAAGGDRVVPRDRVDPELVVREQVSPLAGYRASKRDAALDEVLFTVEAPDGGALPERLRMAVLDATDGADFFVGAGEAGRFTRFPSGEAVADPTRLHVEIGPGYDGIWLPLAAPLAEPPRFSGPRADELADHFYVNRDSWSAIAVPDGRGVREGDGFTARVGAAPAPGPAGEPAQAEPLIDLERTPELARWLAAQRLPRTAQGLAEAVERLRDRGYLSHSLTDGEGEREWLERLAEDHGTRFVTSPGGHSISRVEQLFAQLNEQQRAAGERADERALVAGIGDDEQFAAAAALLARAMGFESRVVLGVRLGEADAGVPGVPACAAACTGEHLAAWIEVRGADARWAPLDVSPQVDVPPSALERGEQLPEFPTVPEEQDASEADPPAGTSGDSEEREEEPERGDLAALWSVLRAVGLALLALALLALPLLVLPVAKRVRARRRRRRAVPETRALGAWDELVDRYADAGRVAPADSGRLRTAAVLGPPEGEWIAATADRAVYAREGITSADADELWRRVDAAIAHRRSELGLRRRIGAALSPRSLLPPRRRGGRDGARAAARRAHKRVGGDG